ncbi:MAG: M48 family metallopeptidase [Desulfuromonadaceae bacterium]|nr:M48 family metallopeptidase [Desulfuromonadaceae bacterium]
MKFSPKALAGNVNVSSGHPLTELAWLLGGLITLLMAVYLAFWLVSELFAPRVSVAVEVWAGQHLLGQLQQESNPALQKRLDGLLAVLPAESPLHRYHFSVSVVNNEEINALALPGGHIVVFSGLLKEIRSENELAMILAHELGHYARRDHLRGMGRGLGMTMLLATLFGQDSRAAGIASGFFSGLEMRYSQQQESAADTFGLQLLTARYGHAGGASDFFERLADKAGNRFSYLLASHPHPQARSASLQQMITDAGYRRAETLPLQGEKLLNDHDPPAIKP